MCIKSSHVTNKVHSLLFVQFVLGRVVAVDWVVPKSQYEEAKLASEQDSDGDDDSDEVQSSCSADEHKSLTEQLDEDGPADDDDIVASEDDNVTSGSGAEESDEPVSEQSEDEEKVENFAEDKVKPSEHKKKLKNDVAEGRTIFIRYT